MVYYSRAIILLTLVYLALTGNGEVSNIVFGILLSIGIVALIRPQMQITSVAGIATAVITLIRYILILAWDLLISGVQVAFIVLKPQMPIHQGILAIHSNCRTELGIALSAHAITLTPGELVVEIDESGIMYTHCLDIYTSESSLAEEQQKRLDMLNKIFP
jgi:multicomponent Na+:H+ antiporter subunit E